VRLWGDGVGDVGDDVGGDVGDDVGDGVGDDVGDNVGDAGDDTEHRLRLISSSVVCTCELWYRCNLPAWTASRPVLFPLKLALCHRSSDAGR